MKEATGEANMTIITVVLIAIILAAGTILVKSLMDKTKQSGECTAQGLCSNPAGGCMKCPEE